MPGDGGPRRSHFRLRIPAAERPTLHVGGAALPVTELSEGGCRVVAAAAPGPVAAGWLVFRGGERVPVEGVAVRTDGDEVVVRFTAGVSLGTMVRLQRRLARAYPDVLRPPAGPPDPS